MSGAKAVFQTAVAVAVIACILAVYSSVVLSASFNSLVGAPDGLPRKLLATRAVYQSANICEALHATLGDNVLLLNEPKYNERQISYYTLQASSLSPRCIVLPQSAEQVSSAVFALGLGEKKWPGHCNFAIRSGGHATYAGTANIQDGVVIDLGKLNSAIVSDDASSVDIGPGMVWEEVYAFLEARGLITPGGRSGNVGVGGLVTGGGLNFFLHRYGFTSNNVLNYEVVLANGAIVNASKDSHPELWQALQGGSSNFGVVTRFTLRTFEHGPFWGGLLMHGAEQQGDVVKAVVDIIEAPDFDRHVAIIHAAVWHKTMSGLYTFPMYTKALPLSQPEEYPAALAPLTNVKPVLHSTLRVANLSAFVRDMTGYTPKQEYALSNTISYTPNAAVMSECYEAVAAYADKLVTGPNGLDGLQISLSY